jgi:hypothetical protein
VKESPLFARTYDLLLWLIPQTLKFPREHRFTMAQRVQDVTLDFQERIIEAALSDAQRQDDHLAQADVDLTKLRLYLRLCKDLQLLSLGQYEHVSRMVVEIGKLLGGWRRKFVGTGQWKPGVAGRLVEQQSEQRPLR